MKNLIISLGAAALLSAAVVGCGGADCESLCEDAKSCEGASQSVDCQASCDKTEKLNDAAGCTSQYDDMLSCADGADVCDANACKSEAEAYGKCITDYCMKDPTNPPSECQ